MRRRGAGLDGDEDHHRPVARRLQLLAREPSRDIATATVDHDGAAREDQCHDGAARRMTGRTRAILNPGAGSGRAAGRIRATRDVLDAAWPGIDWRESTSGA